MTPGAGPDVAVRGLARIPRASPYTGRQVSSDRQVSGGDCVTARALLAACCLCYGPGLRPLQLSRISAWWPGVSALGCERATGRIVCVIQCACPPSLRLRRLSRPPVAAEEIRDTLVVTASRVPVPLVAAGSSVSVIDREQIEARQAVFAVDLLQAVPGVTVSRSGSIGSQTQVRVRGAEANQVLVLIDGIEANDPAGNDEFAFQDLTTWDVERIEVVRGPQSALWGSDALSGVINVITRQPTEEFSAASFAEVGAYGTSISVAGWRAGSWARGPDFPCPGSTPAAPTVRSLAWRMTATRTPPAR